MTTSANSLDRRNARAPSARALWFPLLAGPAAWAVHLNLSYWSVSWICATRRGWLLHVVALAALLLALAGAVVAWRNWQAVMAGDFGDGRADQRRGPHSFSTFAGLAISTFFVLVVAAGWIPNFLVDPCQ